MGRYSGNCELDGIRFITGPAKLNYSSSFLSGPAAVMALPLGNTSRCFSQRTHLLARLFYAIPSGRFGPALIHCEATRNWIADNCGLYIGQGSNSAAYTTAEYV